LTGCPGVFPTWAVVSLILIDAWEWLPFVTIIYIAALTSLPGVGVWTAAETAQRAFGDADALSVGDYHLAKVVGWTLLGHPIDDAEMVRLLEPLRPHRYRAVRLLEVSGLARYARFGPRQAIKDLSRL